MKKIPRSYIRDYILTASVFVLLGILFLLFPENSRNIVCYIFGGFLCFFGVICAVEYFRSPVSLQEYSHGFVIGLIALGAGIFFLIRHELLSEILPTVLAISVLLDSLIKLQNTLDMLRLHDNKWLLTLIIALITAILGTVILFNPFKTEVSLLLYLGISLIFNGILDAIALFAFYRRMKNTKVINTVSEEESDLY